MKKLDWIDIILHCVGAVALAIVAEHYHPESFIWLPVEVRTPVLWIDSWQRLEFGVLGWSLINWTIWLGRELWQHRPDFHEVVTRPQPLAEWVFPSVLFPVWWLL